MPPFDLTETDRLLSTTRAVRKRLDLERPVEPEVLLDCLRLSQQAPTAGNGQTWRWVVVMDPDKRSALAELYRRAAASYLQAARDNIQPGQDQTRRVYDSALWLAENMHRVPVMVIPCVNGRPPESGPGVGLMWAASMGSIFPAVWSFQLALRARGLGSVLTSLHLFFEKDAAQLLGIPDDVLQVAMLPVGYTKGTDFKPAERPPVEQIVHWDTWGEQHAPRG